MLRISAVAASILAVSVMSSGWAAELPPLTADGYRLVWADEFDGAGAPDGTSWSPETGFVRNHELQWYQLANANRRDGMLVIEARRERIPNPDHESGTKEWKKARAESEFTSASITTSQKHAWLYGRFEIRARVPTAQGTWPALWTLGSAREWPACGEIDIMEAYKGALKANLAWGTGKRWTAKWDSQSIPLAELGADWGSTFHVWRMDWTAERIVLSIDGRVLKTTELSRTVNADGSNPFREPHYLLLNLAVGGDAAGDPGATVFPQRMEIDYVRVYQKP